MSCVFLGGAGPGEVWVRGDLPVGAVGARLHHGRGRPCCGGPVKVYLWCVSEALQWPFVTGVCECCRLITGNQMTTFIFLNNYFEMALMMSHNTVCSL